MSFKNLSLKEKIAQTVISLNVKEKEINGTIGGVFIGAQVITEIEDGITATRNIVNKYQKQMDVMPLFAADLENGVGSVIEGLTPLPFLMSLGATDDETLAYDYGRSTALEAKTVGVNISFSPVCDLNKNFRNPLVNVRSLTDKVDRAIPMLKQIIKGMQDNGLAATAKHFPGDGIDWRDQHIITTENSLSMDEWWQYSGRVFKELIDAGVSAIMPGHITLPAYQKERIDGKVLPATLSKELLTDLLKGEMGFKGLVISDATMMGGFNGYYENKTRAELEAFKAGCDIILWPTDEYVDAVAEAIESGYIPISRLEDALERIKTFKEKYVLNRKGYYELSKKEKEFVLSTQKKTAENSITLVRNTKSLFPLKKDIKKIVLVSLCNHNAGMAAVNKMEEELKNRHIQVVHYLERPSDEEFDAETKDADLILYAMYTRSFRPVGPIDFWEDKCWTIAKSYYHSTEKTAYVSFGNPYFANQYFERANTYVNAYSMLAPSVTAFVKAMFGEIDFSSYSPVDLKL